MKLRTLFSFLKKSIGIKLLATLVLTSCLFAFIKLVNIILPFFVEKFINDIQKGKFCSLYLYEAACIYAVSFLMQSLVSYIYGRKQIQVKNRLQLKLTDSILRQNPQRIKTLGEGFFSKLLDQSVDTIVNTITPYNVYTALLIFQNIIIIVILYSKNRWAGSLCTVLFIFYFVAYIINSRLFSAILMEFIERTNSSMSVTYDFIRGNKSLVASQKALAFANTSIRKILYKVRASEFRLQFFFDLLFSTLNNLIQPCINLLMIAILGHDVIRNGMSFGTFVLIITFYNIFQSGLNNFQSVADTLFRAQGAVESLAEFTSQDTSIIRKGLDYSSTEYFFHAENLFMTVGTRTILKKSSFVLECGRHYALIGFSGLGKSSLANAFLGLRTVDSGNIWFMNPNNEVSEVWSFENMAWLSQDTDIFNMSLEENIFLGDEHDESEYQSLIKLFGLENLLNRQMGSLGSCISGGEKKLVGLARFIHQLKTKAFYFIDEGFVSLDAYTKHKALSIIKEVLHGKTGICITHDNEVFQALCDSILLYDTECYLSQMEKTGSKPLQEYLK